MNLVKDIKHIYNVTRIGFKSRPSVITEQTKFRRMQQSAYKSVKARMGYSPSAEVSALRGDWPTQVVTGTTMIRQDFTNLCARSELAYRTDAWVRRAVNILASFVVGQGLKPFPCIKDDSGNMVDVLNRKLAQDFERFNEQGIRNGTQRLTYYEAQHLAFRMIAVYGNLLTNTVQSRPGDWLPFAFQFLKPTRLNFSRDTYFDSPTWTYIGKPMIVHGIEMNDFAEPVNFHIWGIPDPVPAKNMWINYFPLETDCYMGLPWTTPSLGNVWDNQQIFEDKLKQSRIAARLGLRIKPEERDAFAAAIDSVSESGDQYIDLDFQGLVAAKDGSLEPLKMDDTIEQSFLPLVKHNLIAFAVGMGFSYQALSSDMDGASFASSRANLINDNRYFRGLFRFFTKTVEQLKWNKFVEWEILTGKLAGMISYSDYLRDPWRFQQAFWLPLDGEDWVDPLKDAQALQLLYGLGQVTFQELCAMAGKDYMTVLQQRQKEKELFKSMNVEELVPTGKPQPTGTNDNSKEENNQ